MSDSVTPAETARTIVGPGEADGPGIGTPTRTDALARADDAARGYANRSRAPSTWRAYEADWRGFGLWCRDAGVPALPASPRDVARYLAIEAMPSAERPDGRAVSTLRRRLAAVRLMHLRAGHLSPHGASEVTEVLRGIANARRDVRGAKKAPVLERRRLLHGRYARPSNARGAARPHGAAA